MSSSQQKQTPAEPRDGTLLATNKWAERAICPETESSPSMVTYPAEFPKQSINRPEHNTTDTRPASDKRDNAGMVRQNLVAHHEISLQLAVKSWLETCRKTPSSGAFDAE